jgi:ribosome production factor 2
MIEIGVENFKSFYDFECEKVNIGQRPCFMFVGEEFTQKAEYKALANVLLDLYQGENVSLVNLTGIEHVIIVSASGDKVYFRVYRILFKKSGSRTPRVELEEMGPSFDIVLRRQHLPSHEISKMANQVPSQLMPKKVKNISKDVMETRATIHMPRQDLNTLATRKMKGLDKKRKVEGGDNTEDSSKLAKMEE